MKIFIGFLFLSLLVPQIAFASAVQAMQQKRAQEEAMMQQAIIQQQLQQQAQVQAIQRAVVQDQMHQRVLQQGLQQEIQQNLQQGRIPVFPTEAPPQPQPSYVPQVLKSAPVADSQVAQVSEMKDILRSLDQSSKIWPLIADMQPKVYVVQEYIERFRQNGIGIQQPAEYYVQIIDSMIQQDPSALNLPFASILQVTSILEYDFNNGQDKDQMALQILGQEAFLANRQRLGIQ